MPSQQDLVTRVRDALQDRSPRELRMFGGISFMVDDRMVAAARRDGEILLRIDPASSDDLLAQPGASPAVMGADRPMGPGWLSVGPEGLEGSDLDAWLGHALSFHAAHGST